MKKILFTFALLLFYVSTNAQTANRKIWTKEYESEVSGAIYNVADTLFKMPQQKKEYVEYCLSALKKQLPNGLSSVSDDKLKSIFFEIGKSYSLQSKYLTLKEWTPEYEEIIKRDLYDSPMLTSLNNKTRLYYCDCYVKGLKEVYPKGVSNRVPKDIQNRIGAKCVELIKANASSLKN